MYCISFDYVLGGVFLLFRNRPTQREVARAGARPRTTGFVSRNEQQSQPSRMRGGLRKQLSHENHELFTLKAYKSSQVAENPYQGIYLVKSARTRCRVMVISLHYKDASTMRKLLITTLLTLACSSAMATQMYKWVDENGVTQFSQQPPTDNQYQRMNVTPPPQPTAPTPQAQTASEGEAAATDTEATQQQVADPEYQAELAAYCASLRERLTTMENNPRLRRTREDGSVERITEEERQEMISKAKADLQTHCQN